MNYNRKLQQLRPKGQINWGIVAYDIVEALEITNHKRHAKEKELKGVETGEPKTCVKCNTEYPAKHIYFETYMSKGYKCMRTTCRTCRNIRRKEISKKYYENNK